MLTKICKVCKKNKSINGFYKDSSRKSGHRNACKSCMSIMSKDWRQSLRGSFLEIKRSAKRRNYIFDLKYEEFLKFKNKPCHYCGIKMEKIGLDRVDNSLGYTISNSVPCCATCNFMKHKNSEEEFLKHVEKIYLHQKKVGYGE